MVMLIKTPDYAEQNHTIFPGQQDPYYLPLADVAGRWIIYGEGDGN